VFDIYSLPLHRRAGQESVRLPGLLVKSAPNKTHRNRTGDILFLFLTLEGDSRLPASQMEELLERLSAAYFNSRGSATTGLRSVAEDLNTFLLKRNQSGHGGRQEVGIFNMAVLRRNQLFVVHAGDTHSFFLGKMGIQTLYEPFTAGRGLGVGRSLQLSYFQTETTPGDLLIFCPNPPESWAAGTLEDIARLPLGQIRRRILEPSLEDLQAVVIQFRQGQGRIYQPRVPESQAEAQPAGEVPEPAPETEPVVPIPAVQAYTEEPAAETPPETPPAAAPRRIPTAPAPTPEQVAPAETAHPRRQPRRRQPEIKEKLADMWVSGKATQGKIKNRLSTLFGRVIPGEEGHGVSLSPKAMLGIAIVVPILIAIIASLVYFNSGRNEQHQAYLNKALSVAAEADITSDPTLRATSWMQVLSWLDQAEAFGQTQESQALRAKAQEKLDTINDITRLNYYPILTTELDKNMRITRMVASESDIYFLDSTKGEIHRLIQSGQDFAYSLDQNFKCGPGQIEGVTIQPLVDMVVLNKKRFSKPIPLGATIMAVDGAGHYLFCVPDLNPTAGEFQSPDAGWGEVKDVAMTDDGRLFMLNPDNNAVWFIDYDDSQAAKSLTYANSEPRLFFDEVFPVLTDVVDLTYFEDELYLLHNTGTITLCEPRIRDVKQTTCSDMVIDLTQYAANNNAPANTGLIQNQFAQLMSNSAPYSALSILDSQQGVIYQFTARLKTLNEKFYPKFDAEYETPTGQPTAFTIVSPGNRVFILAYGNRLFKAVP
jgi:hypothetical protein